MSQIKWHIVGRRTRECNAGNLTITLTRERSCWCWEIYDDLVPRTGWPKPVRSGEEKSMAGAKDKALEAFVGLGGTIG